MLTKQVFLVLNRQSFQTCSNFFSANKTKQRQSLTYKKKIVIQNKCVSQVQSSNNGTFQ